MIKEYEDIKLFLERYISCRYLEAAVSVTRIFLNEYNALDINVLGANVSNGRYNKFISDVNATYNNIVTTYDVIKYDNQTSIIVYLKTPEEIRSGKIYKIRKLITTI